MKRRMLACLLALTLIFGLSAALGESTVPGWDGWLIPAESNEIPENVQSLYDKAMEGLLGVNYEPLLFLGEKEGVYCVFCRAAAVVPDAKTYYTLVYVTEAGLQNVYDIWMDKHAEKPAD